MQITVRLYGGLARYRPPDAGRVGPFSLQVADDATVAEVGEQLGIPADWVRKCFVNGEAAKRDYALADGDQLVLFPPSGGGEKTARVERAQKRDKSDKRSPRMIAEMLFLSRQDLIGLGLSIHDVIAVVEDAIRQQSEDKVQMPDKVALYYDRNRAMHGMPAYIPSQGALGIKWVGSVPANNARDLPQTSGLVILNDPETAFPIAVMDGTWITAMRTGAISAITAKHLAPRNVKVLGLVGAGVQMRTQLMALNTVLQPQQVRIYDTRPQATDAFVAQMSQLVQTPIEPCATPRDAVEGADVVVSATWLMTPPDPQIKEAWLKPGALVMPIDVDSVWEPSSYLNADKFVTDRWGPIEHLGEIGGFPGGLPKLYAELHELVGGHKPGRQSDDERIVAMNTGMAIDDIPMGKLAYDRAREKGVGTRLPFIASAEEVFQF